MRSLEQAPYERMEFFEEEKGSKPFCSSRPRRSLRKYMTQNCHAFEGTFYAALTGLFYTFNPMLIKFLPFNAIELLFFMDIGLIIFNLPYIIRIGKIEVKRPAVILITMLMALNFVAILCQNKALKILPLGDASVIAFSSPLFQAISARIFLKERITVTTILSVVISIVGLCLTLRLPDLLTSGDFEQRFGTSSHLIGCALAMTTVLIFSVTALIPRKLKETPHIQVIIPFFTGLTRGIIGTIAFPLFGLLSSVHECSFKAWLLVAFTMIRIPQLLLLNMALKADEAYFVSAVTLSVDIFLSFVWQITIFGESVELYSLMGAVIVFFGGLLMPFAKFVKSKPEYSITRKWFNFLT